jgi:hypothetical protein
MSNETKRDVFEELLESYMYSEDIVIDEISTDGVADRLNLGNIIASTRDRYAAALPDDLPVIPKAVGEYIKWGKSYDIQLYMMYSFKFIHSQGFKKLTDNVESWIISNSDTFALAWVLCAWRVEETGEIVKLEAEVRDDN